MPILSECRDAERLIRFTVLGAFDAAEVREALGRHEANNTWSYGVLWDLRRMAGHPTTDELWSFSRAYAHDPHARRPARGPVAIVTADEDMFRAACLYVVMAQQRMHVDVFRQVDEAEAWLVARLARP